MAFKSSICVIYLCLVLIIENNDAKKSSARQEPKGRQDQLDVIRLTQSKSRLSRAKLAKNQEERRLGQEYVEQYQEMMKPSQESFENFDENRDEKRLRRLIGNDDLELMAEAGGLARHARSGANLQAQSVVGRRRARSEAIRRNKLQVQSNISHRRHSKQNNIIYGDYH